MPSGCPRRQVARAVSSRVWPVFSPCAPCRSRPCAALPDECRSVGQPAVPPPREPRDLARTARGMAARAPIFSRPCKPSRGQHRVSRHRRAGTHRLNRPAPVQECSPGRQRARSKPPARWPAATQTRNAPLEKSSSIPPAQSSAELWVSGSGFASTCRSRAQHRCRGGSRGDQDLNCMEAGTVGWARTTDLLFHRQAL